MADALHRAKLIEGWGTETLRIILALEERGMASPQFRFEMGAFIVCFESPSLVFEKSLEPPLSDTLLTERQRKTVAYVREAESITNKQYRQLFDLKERRACEELVEMVGQEFLNRAGQGRTIHYIMPD